jgi:hypothetical protein
MVRSIVRKGERYNILINVLMPGAGGITATCGECPELLELGDDPRRCDDARRRMVEAIEHRAGRAHDVTGE